MKDVYQIEIIQPVDMFPQTHHVENVVLLKKRIQEKRQSDMLKNVCVRLENRIL